MYGYKTVYHERACLLYSGVNVNKTAVSAFLYGFASFPKTTHICKCNLDGYTVTCCDDILTAVTMTVTRCRKRLLASLSFLSLRRNDDEGTLRTIHVFSSLAYAVTTTKPIPVLSRVFPAQRRFPASQLSLLLSIDGLEIYAVHFQPIGN